MIGSALTPCRLRPPRGTPPRGSLRALALRRSGGPRRRAARRARGPGPAAPRGRAGLPSSVSISTPRACERSSGRPAATTRPRDRITTRSQTSSISLSRCELRRTPIPRSRSCSSSARTVRRPAGSSALVGSSSSSTGGEPTSACAIPSRCCIPLDIASTRTARAFARPTSSSSCARSPSPPGERTSRWWRPQHLVGGVPAGETEELGEVAERGAGGRRSGRRSADLRAAAGRANQPAGDLDEGRLPCSVRSEQAHELAGLRLPS